MAVEKASTQGDNISTVTERSFVLSTLERQYVVKALQLQIASLKRSMAAEIAGSDIYRFRLNDKGVCEKLLDKFS